jgi:hypothetical protein
MGTPPPLPNAACTPSAASLIPRASAAAEPLFVVLEDLHASDPASLRLTELLAPRLGSAPLLVVATFRLGDVDTDPSVERMLGALVRRGDHLPLAGLDREAARSVALAGPGARRLPLPRPSGGPAARAARGLRRARAGGAGAR